MNQRVGGWHRLLARKTAKRSLRTLIGGAALAFSLGVTPPTIAAERLGAQFGPFQASVAIADLETFVETGQVPPSLQPYRFLLTQELRQIFTSTASLHPSFEEDFVTNLLRSTNGDRLVRLLQTLIVDSTQEEITLALARAAQQPEGLSLLSILRAYPESQLTVNLGAAIALTAQMPQPQEEIESVLKRSLTIPTRSFQAKFDPTTPGNNPVQQETFTFRDWPRRRTLVTDVYWSEQQRGPLVILSHGFGADRRFLTYLGEHLASHGFTVVAVEHPASSVAWLTRLMEGRRIQPDRRSLLPATEFIDRPQDIQFLLDELDQLEQRFPWFQGRFNTEQVTVIGHSLGGYTALALAGAELQLDQLRAFCSQPDQISLEPADWLQCTAADLPDQLPVLKDSRVAQIIALNPVVGQLFTPASLAQIRVPTMFLSNTRDTITPPIDQQLLPFQQLQTEKYLLTAIGATHLSAGTPNTLNEALTDSLFLRERPSDETEPLRQLLKGISLAFAKQVTPEAANYRPFLSSAYVQSLSTSDLQLQMTTDLPPLLVTWLESLTGTHESVAESFPQRLLAAHLPPIPVQFGMPGIPWLDGRWLLFLTLACTRPPTQRAVWDN